MRGQSARRRFGVAVHHADLLADLIDEDDARPRLAQRRVEHPQRLAHEAGLHPHARLADVVVQFVLGHERRHGVDDDEIHRVGLHEHLGDPQRLLAVARLADEERFEIDAELLGPGRVEGVFGVDVGDHAAGLLDVRRGVQRDGRFAGAFGAVDLDDATAREALAAEGDIEADGAAADAFDLLRRHIAEGHDGPFAEFLLDLIQSRLQLAVVFGGCHSSDPARVGKWGLPPAMGEGRIVYTKAVAAKCR